MNRNIAISLLDSEINLFLEKTWDELCAHFKDDIYVIEKIGVDNIRYTIEINLLWNSKSKNSIRILGGIDNGGWSACFPLSRSVVKNHPSLEEERLDNERDSYISFSNFPLDLFFAPMPIVVILGIIAASVLQILFNIKGVYWLFCTFISFFIACLGALFVYLAKKPLYLRKRFFSIGSKRLPQSSHRFYWWGMTFSIVGCLMMLLLIGNVSLQNKIREKRETQMEGRENPRKLESPLILSK